LKNVILTLVALLLIFSFAFEASAQGEVLNIGHQPNLHHLAKMVTMEKSWWP
jgi:hypothetical protein